MPAVMPGGDAGVVLTGCGLLSPWGIGVTPFREGLGAQRLALQPLADGGACARVDDDLLAGLLGSIRGLREFDRTAQLLAGAALEALRREECDGWADGAGIVVGSTYGSISSIASFDTDALTEGPAYVRPLAFPNTVLNAPAGRVGKLLGIKGVNATLSTGETSGLDAVIYGAEWIGRGRCARMLAGCGFGLSEMLRGALPTELGEGAGMFQLERADVAGERGMARLSGFASAFLAARYDAVDLAAEAIGAALRAAGCGSDDIDVIISSERHPQHRKHVEAEALERVFAARATVHSTRHLLGDCLDASGAFQIAAALHFIAHGTPRVLISGFARSGQSSFLVLEAMGVH